MTSIYRRSMIEVELYGIYKNYCSCYGGHMDKYDSTNKYITRFDSENTI